MSVVMRVMIVVIFGKVMFMSWVLMVEVIMKFVMILRSVVSRKWGLVCVVVLFIGVVVFCCCCCFIIGSVNRIMVRLV